jgi:ribosomal protein S18 acetylase RimI-like enzyme
LNEIFIRQATAKDAELISSISRRTFIEAFGQFNTKENMESFLQNDFNKDRLMAQVSETGNFFLLAYFENELAGYVRMVESANPPALGEVAAIEIARIYSEQKFIGKGIGKALLLNCFELAAAGNKKMIWLGVWEHNQRAIDFYSRFGFEKFGDHIFMLGDDRQIDWLMKKDL